MKFGCCLSILVFLFICLQLQLRHSEAVKCPFNRHNLNETKECSACAFVLCGFDGDGTAGCSSDDLFKNCPKKYDNDIDFIKRRSIKFYKNDTFEYFSGCSGAVNGTKCMQDEGRKILEEIEKKGVKEYKEPYYIENNANNQNDSLKLIGFIAIGWILVAWIY